MDQARMKQVDQQQRHCDLGHLACVQINNILKIMTDH